METVDKETYVQIYGEDDYDKDEKNFNQVIKSNDVNKLDLSSFKRLMLHDLCRSDIIESGYIGHYKLEDIKNALKEPKSRYKILLDASEWLMRVSPHYNKLNTMYSNISMCNWWLDLYDVRINTEDENAVSNLVKSYDILASRLENMNLKHEFAKIMKVLPYKDIYCGLVMESESDFFIQEINFKMCKLKQVQDGLYNFAIDLNQINPLNINAYPDYVKGAYIDFKEGNLLDNWYVPPADKQICIKMNCQWTFPFPLLLNIVQDIFDLDIYKKLKLQSARNDNYKAIATKVPIDTNTIDKPLLTPGTLGVFAEINKESMSDDIGLIHTLGSDAQVISFKDSNNTRNNVADATDDLYNSSGHTQELFNGSSAGTAVTMSIENDSGFIYDIYRQWERWINRYIKLKNKNRSNYKFIFYMLDMTNLNKDKVISRYKEACTLGVTAKGQYLASLGMTPSRTKGSFIMEKCVFDFQNNFVPLNSTYTQSSEVGRPTNESQNKTLSESGEKTQTLESNTKR